MISLQAARQALATSRHAGMAAVRSVARTQQREFNQQTLDNVYKYLVENQEDIKFERNESGFIRTAFPVEVFQPDERVAPLEEGERLRANFWFDNKCGMGDESIHDHPSAFQSYIVNGGYKHELYRVTFQKDPKVFQPSMLLNREQLWELYEKFIKSNAGPDDASAMSRKFKFSIDKATKIVTFEGPVMLRMTGVEETKEGDIVDIDSKMIHRVSQFQTVPGKKTLSLNIVRNEGKGKTNIYLPEEKTTAVKVVREAVSKEDTVVAAKEMTAIFARARKEMAASFEAATLHYAASKPK